MRDIVPVELTTFLGSSETIVSLSREIPKKDSQDRLEVLIEIVSLTVLNVANPYYKKFDIPVGPVLFNFLLEPLKNANYYSESDKDILFGIMMSKNGLVASYNDGGPYFHRTDVKYCYEHKILHQDKSQSTINGIGYGRGTKILYEIADIIFVDTINGTLYTGISVDNQFFKSRV